jgi:allantoicase
MDISINALYMILVLSHLAASGGQVWASDVIDDGTNSIVLAFFNICGAALICSTVAASASWCVFTLLTSHKDVLNSRIATSVAVYLHPVKRYDFLDGHRRALAKGHRWAIVALGVVSAIKSIAFLEAFK